MQEIVTIGRRKCARARVRMRPGTGRILINGRPIDEYLAREVLVMTATQPFALTDSVGKYDIRARCDGDCAFEALRLHCHGGPKNQRRCRERLRP